MGKVPCKFQRVLNGKRHADFHYEVTDLWWQFGISPYTYENARETWLSGYTMLFFLLGEYYVIHITFSVKFGEIYDGNLYLTLLG